jgi:hypothetical protein
VLKAAYASQPLHGETGHSLSSGPHPSPDSPPEDLNSSNNNEENHHFTPVFCASALSPHVYSDACRVPAGEGEGEEKKSTPLGALGYAYVTESISRPPDATTHYVGNQAYEMIKKIKVSGRKIREDDVEVLTRSLIDNYAENNDGKSSALDERIEDVEQNEHALIPEYTIEVLGSGPDSGTLPAALADCIETFVRRSGVCNLQCISSVCVYNDSSSSSSSKLRLRSLVASPVASCSATNAEPYEILLVTASSYDSESCEASDTLSDVRVLDSSLVTLAVLGMGDYGALSAATCSTDHSLDRPEEWVESVTAPQSKAAEGVESMTAPQSKALSVNMFMESAAIDTITSACFVPSVCAPQPMPLDKVGEFAVALVTAYSKECPVLSNKLLFWQPDIRSRGIPKISSPEESAVSHTQESVDTLIAALAASSSDLPFTNMPATSGGGSKKEVSGSRGPCMLMSTCGLGRHQHLVLGDFNGHVWGTVIGPHTDFPGPMYPPGFTLMQRIESYMEREDELDNPLPTSAEEPPCDFMEEQQDSSSDPQPLIDVGVSPYYTRDPAVASLTPNDDLCTNNTVISRFCQRLPLRVLGAAREALLERKAKAILLRKASMARVRGFGPSKKRPPVRGGNSRFNKKKRKKMPLASIEETKERSSNDDDCIASDTCSPLPPMTSPLPDGALVREELGGFTASSSSSSSLRGAAGVEDDTEVYGLDAVDRLSNATASTKTKASSGHSKDGDRDGDGDRPQHEDSEDSESDSEAGPGSMPPSHLGNAEERSSCVPAPSLTLSDVLPVPRRVLTGDFAARLSKAKEVSHVIFWSLIHSFSLHDHQRFPFLSTNDMCQQIGLAITMKRLSSEVLAEKLLNIEVIKFPESDMGGSVLSYNVSCMKCRRHVSVKFNIQL